MLWAGSLCNTEAAKKCANGKIFVEAFICRVGDLAENVPDYIARKVCQNMTGVLAGFFAYAITSRNWNDFKQRRDFPRLSIKQERNYNLEDGFRILKAV